MKHVRDMIRNWAGIEVRPETVAEISIPLCSRDYARIRALTELYASLTEKRLVQDLISAALDEVEEAMPYVKGSRVIAEDEFGDPVYEDVGLTPKFESLAHKYAQQLKQK